MALSSVLSETAATASSQPIAAASFLRICSHASTFAAAAESLTQSSLKVITAFIEGFVMRSVYEEKVAVASENARQIRQGTAKIVSASKFGIVAKALWPFKTAAHIAAIAKSNERTASRWLSGEFEPPGIVYAAILTEITRRE